MSRRCATTSSCAPRAAEDARRQARRAGQPRPAGVAPCPARGGLRTGGLACRVRRAAPAPRRSVRRGRLDRGGPLGRRARMVARAVADRAPPARPGPRARAGRAAGRGRTAGRAGRRGGAPRRGPQRGRARRRVPNTTPNATPTLDRSSTGRRVSIDTAAGEPGAGTARSPCRRLARPGGRAAGPAAAFPALTPPPRRPRQGRGFRSGARSPGWSCPHRCVRRRESAGGSATTRARRRSWA